MTRINGDTFSKELDAAGVVDRRFTWNCETGVIEFHPEVSQQERDKVMAVLAAHDPEAPPLPPRVMTALAFIERFTADEQLAIATAAQSDASVNLWLVKATGAQEVDLDDPRTVDGLAALVSKGLITPERRDEILGL